MPPHMRARGAALTPQVAGETKESLLQQEKEEEERLRQERREKTAAKRRAAKQAGCPQFKFKYLKSNRPLPPDRAERSSSGAPQLYVID